MGLLFLHGAKKTVFCHCLGRTSCFRSLKKPRKDRYQAIKEEIDVVESSMNVTII